jgi:hypothetical protein
MVYDLDESDDFPLDMTSLAFLLRLEGYRMHFLNSAIRTDSFELFWSEVCS